MGNDVLGPFPEDDLLAALHDALDGESRTVMADGHLLERVSRKCHRARRRGVVVRLAAPLLVVALLAGAGRASLFPPAPSPGAAPGTSVPSLTLAGPPIRLSGFQVPTPVHYTPTTEPCGLHTHTVYAVSNGGAACLQVLLVSRARLQFPASATWLTVATYKAVLLHDRNGFTKLTVIVPAHAVFRLIVLSARSMNDKDLVALARSIKLPRD